MEKLCHASERDSQRDVHVHVSANQPTAHLDVGRARQPVMVTVKDLQTVIAACTYSPNTHNTALCMYVFDYPSADLYKQDIELVLSRAVTDHELNDIVRTLKVWKKLQA